MYSAKIIPVTVPAINKTIIASREPIQRPINPKRIIGAAKACNQKIILINHIQIRFEKNKPILLSNSEKDVSPASLSPFQNESSKTADELLFPVERLYVSSQ